MEKQQSKQAMQKSMRPGAGRRFVRRGKGNSNKNNNKSVGDNMKLIMHGQSYLVVHVMVELKKFVLRWKMECL